MLTQTGFTQIRSWYLVHMVRCWHTYFIQLFEELQQLQNQTIRPHTDYSAMWQYIWNTDRLTSYPFCFSSAYHSDLNYELLWFQTLQTFTHCSLSGCPPCASESFGVLTKMHFWYHSNWWSGISGMDIARGFRFSTLTNWLIEEVCRPHGPRNSERNSERNPHRYVS